MRWIIATCLLMTLLFGSVGCDRNPGAGGASEYGTATHPWELGDDSIASGIPELANQESEASYDTEAEVTHPTLRGPALSEHDTLDPELIPGIWAQVCVVRAEIMNIYPLEEIDFLELTADGRALLTVRSSGEIYQTIEGKWRKPEPGRFGMSLAGSREDISYGEMFGENFMYIWDYEVQLGVWYARLQVDATPTIEGNRFNTSRGDLHFTSIVANSYEGYLTGTNQVDLRGSYLSGVIIMRWEDQKGKLGGFAAFIVDPSWQTIDGVWWKDDYEAAPFGGPWTGTRMAAPVDGESTDAAT